MDVRRLWHSSVSPTTDAYTGCSLHPRRADSSSGARGRASSYSARECCPVFSLCFYLGVVCASRYVLAGGSSVSRHVGLDGRHPFFFSDPLAFASGINQAHLGRVFQTIRDAFPTPEDINNSPITAPSKRVVATYPKYRKVLHGKNGAAAVGIDCMRQECPHFRSWLETIEALAAL